MRKIHGHHDVLKHTCSFTVVTSISTLLF
jgi:hypothetical protein